MERFQSLIKSFFFSRKFWVFIGGVVTYVTNATNDGVFTSIEGRELLLLFAAYIFSIAFEDGMSGRVNWNSLIPLGTHSEAQVFTQSAQIETTVENK